MSSSEKSDVNIVVFLSMQHALADAIYSGEVPHMQSTQVQRAWLQGNLSQNEQEHWVSDGTS